MTLMTRLTARSDGVPSGCATIAARWAQGVVESKDGPPASIVIGSLDWEPQVLSEATSSTPVQ